MDDMKWPNLQDDFKATEQAVKEQEQGLIGMNPSELLQRIQAIKDQIRKERAA